MLSDVATESPCFLEEQLPSIISSQQAVMILNREKKKCFIIVENFCVPIVSPDSALYKKRRGSLYHHLPHVPGLRIAHQVRISNAEAHADMYIDLMHPRSKVGTFSKCL